MDLTEAALARVLPALKTEREIFITRGDQKLDLNLLTRGEGGGKGLFTRELEDALLRLRFNCLEIGLLVFRVTGDPGLSRALAGIELVLSVALFTACAVYVRVRLKVLPAKAKGEKAAA